MGALSDEAGTLKFIHTYGAGLHSGDSDPDVHDPRWQQRQVNDFVDFAVLAEELGFDGITVTDGRVRGVSTSAGVRRQPAAEQKQELLGSAR